ncbi:MAG: F0F1 ATP synthase subunit epsilon [Clostridiales bacterium]|nr:F0F1 ATP synthase subunit epsilon [Clostridiales bacterium]
MASTFRLQIIAPDRIFYDDEVEMVAVSTQDGGLGVLARHIPLVAPLVIGRVKIKKGGQSKEAAISEGFIQVKRGYTRVITDSAEWPEEIDVERAEAAKKRAEELLRSRKSHVDIMRAEAALQRAIIRLRVANRL